MPQRGLRPARWRWVTENGKSGLRPRPPGSLRQAGLEAPERDVITAPIPAVALLEAVRAMTEPEPPIDLGLYGAPPPAVGEESPRSSRRFRPALPLAAEFGLEHLIDAELRPRRSWSLWLRAHSLWIAAGVLLLWLVASFALRWLALLP